MPVAFSKKFIKKGADGKVRARTATTPRKAVQLAYEGWVEVTPALVEQATASAGRPTPPAKATTAEQKSA